MHSCCKMGNSLTALFLPPLAKIEKDFATQVTLHLCRPVNHLFDFCSGCHGLVGQILDGVCVL